MEHKIRSLRESLERMGINTNHPQTVLQWKTLFSKIANMVDNIPMAKGNATNLGYEIITSKRLKLGQNNYRSLEDSGIKLNMSLNLTALLETNCELYCEWYRIFIENIHMLDLRPNKWLKNSRLPVIDDIVLVVFNDSEYGKGGMDRRLGKITAVNGAQVSVSKLLRGSKAKVPGSEKCKRNLHSVFNWGFVSKYKRTFFSPQGVKMKNNKDNDSDLWNRNELCFLTMLHAYQLETYYTTTTQYLAAI